MNSLTLAATAILVSGGAALAQSPPNAGAHRAFRTRNVDVGHTQ